MKPRLLLTIGDSLTEGIGAYDESTIPINFNSHEDIDILFDLYHKNIKNFNKYSWPTQLVQKLGYDKLINLGIGGASTSGNVKQLLESYSTERFEDYEVTVIWLLSEPTRISFYIDGFIQNQNIGNHKGESSIMDLYLSEIKDNDPILEQIFYIKVMEEICHNRKWNLIITYWGEWGKYLIHNHNSKNYLTPYYQPIIPPDLSDPVNVKYKSPVCNHPNKLGYEYMSNLIYDLLKKYHNHLISTPNKGPIEYLYENQKEFKSYDIIKPSKNINTNLI